MASDPRPCEEPRLQPGFFLDRDSRVAAQAQPIASKRFASTFLRTFSGSQMRPFIAM